MPNEPRIGSRVMLDRYRLRTERNQRAPRKYGEIVGRQNPLPGMGEPLWLVEVEYRAPKRGRALLYLESRFFFVQDSRSPKG